MVALIVSYQQCFFQTCRSTATFSLSFLAHSIKLCC